MHSEPLHKMEVSNQLHNLATLPSRYKFPWYSLQDESSPQAIWSEEDTKTSSPSWNRTLIPRSSSLQPSHDTD